MKEEKRKKLPYGVRKFLREEKARIRQTVADPVEVERLVCELEDRFRTPSLVVHNS